MKVEFDKSFSKRVDKVKNQLAKDQTAKFIEEVEAAGTLSELSNIIKLKGDAISY